MDPDDTADYVEPVIALAPMKAENVMREKSGTSALEEITRRLNMDSIQSRDSRQRSVDQDELGIGFDDTPSTSGEYDQNTGRGHSLRKTLGFGALFMAGTVVVVGVGAGVEYGVNVANDLAPHSETSVGVIGHGKALIKKVEIKAQPVTVMTADTDATLSVGFTQKLEGFLHIPMGGGTMIRHASDVKQRFKVDPETVTFSYNPTKKDVELDVSKTALFTEVEIPSDSVETTGGNGSDNFGIGGKISADITDGLGQLFGMDSTKVFLLGNLVKNGLNSDAKIARYADDVIKTQVDKKCTPLIPTMIPDFDKKLENEIKKAAVGELLNPKNIYQSGDEDLLKFLQTALKNHSPIMDHVTVKMPTKSDIKGFQLDQANIKALKKDEEYTKSFDFAKKIPSFECGVSKDHTLDVLKKKNKSTQTNGPAAKTGGTK